MAAKKDLFGESQADLFGDEPAKPRYVPKPEHVRSWLDDALNAAKGAETFPWSRSRRKQLYRNFRSQAEKLPDAEEAETYCEEFFSEYARLEANSPNDDHLYWPPLKYGT